MSPVADFKYYGKNNLRILYEIFFSTNSNAVFLFRLASWFNSRRLKVFAHLLTNLNTTLNGCQISPGAKIEVGFKIYHSVGIVLGRISAGEGFTLYQNTTVGMNHKIAEDGQKFPIIGANVTLHPGALVAGPIKIGDNVRVGANAVVLKDLPNNVTVAGAKSIILEHKAVGRN